MFAQKTMLGQWRILHEIVTFDMGLERFGHLLQTEINTYFPKNEIMIWGDPAGTQRDAIYEVTAFDHLKTLGYFARPTVSNEFKVRREAGASPMNRMIQGKPGLLVNKKCLRLRKALSVWYHFNRVQISGEERYRDTPNKNEHSHIGDAFMYCLLGGGEHRNLTRSKSMMQKGIQTASTDFDIFA